MISIYNGLHEVKLDEQAMADFYQNKNKDNKLGLVENQYLIIKDENLNIVDKYKWSGEKLLDVKFRTIDSDMLGKIKPRNEKQECYFDLLDDVKTKIKVSAGGKGTGKSFVAACWALSQIERGKYDKLVVTRNTYETRNVKPLGFLPGTLESKLGEFLLFFKDIVTKEGYDRLLTSEQIESCHLGTLRGRSIRNSIIWISESQNLTKELVKTIISRAADGSILIFDGDTDQCDSSIFDRDNGFSAMANCLSGNKLFGMVTLDKCERSDVAALAELIK